MKHFELKRENVGIVASKLLIIPLVIKISKIVILVILNTLNNTDLK